VPVTRVYARKPFGLLLPSPLTNAVFSDSANARPTSSASQFSGLKNTSSSAFCVTDGFA
jgi:hypothetical protein